MKYMIRVTEEITYNVDVYDENGNWVGCSEGWPNRQDAEDYAKETIIAGLEE